MKKINKNLFVFIFSVAIIIAGLCSKTVLREIKNIFLIFTSQVQETGAFEAFDNMTDSTEKSLTNNLVYHDKAVDVYSVFSRALQTSVVNKDDMVVIRADNGYLGGLRGFIKDGELKAYAKNVKEFYRLADKSGAKFLYVMAPMKGYDFNYPSNVKDYTATNCDRFIEYLDSYNVPYYNLIKQAEKDGITSEEMFFVTDHHWKPEWGLWASGKVSEFLYKEHGFKYDEMVFNKENYNIKTYKNWFLGSQGKKVGTYFTPYGADDFNIITPKFETDLKEEQPIKGSVREGDFTQTVLYLENVQKKDYYNLNAYAAYSGGDFREQIITNNLIKDGKTILIIRDSYACAFVPFFSLAFEKAYVVDIRDNYSYVGDKIDLEKYIEEIKPDYVMVFYSGMSGNDSLYEFK